MTQTLIGGGIALLLALAVLNLVVLVALNGRAKTQQLTIGDHENRLTRLEEKIRHLPTHEDLRAMRESNARLSELISAVSGRSDVSVKLLQSIQEHLLEKER